MGVAVQYQFSESLLSVTVRFCAGGLLACWLLICCSDTPRKLTELATQAFPTTLTKSTPVIARQPVRHPVRHRVRRESCCCERAGCRAQAAGCSSADGRVETFSSGRMHCYFFQ